VAPRSHRAAGVRSRLGSDTRDQAKPGGGRLATTATDPDVRQRFEEVAANVAASKDLQFLVGVKKPEDLEKPFTTELTVWVVPIATTCDLS